MTLKDIQKNTETLKTTREAQGWTFKGPQATKGRLIFMGTLDHVLMMIDMVEKG